MWKTFNDMSDMVQELNESFILGDREFNVTEDGNIYFNYRGNQDRTAAIISKHFIKNFGFAPEIEVFVEEYEKSIGGCEETGQEMYITRYYNNTTIVLPKREECVELFKAGSKFDKSKQTLSPKDDLYYTEVMGLLAA